MRAERNRGRERERETGANFIAEVSPIFHATKKCAEGQRSRSAITGSSTSLRGQANPGSRMRLPFFICWYLLAHQSEYATGGAGNFFSYSHFTNITNLVGAFEKIAKLLRYVLQEREKRLACFAKQESGMA